jgi:branched-chain amino acid transport system substrate-binding protein
VTAAPRCEQTWPSDLLSSAGEYPSAIVIGSLFDASTHALDADAVRLAIKQANDAGGLEARQFALVACDVEEGAGDDDLTTAEAVAETAAWLADDVGAHAIVGPTTESTVTTAFDAASPYGTLVMSSEATSSALTWLDGTVKTDESPGLLWRTVPPDGLQGDVLARVLADEMPHAARVIVLSAHGGYGGSLVTELTAGLDGTGITVETREFASNQERDSAVQDLAHDPPDGVVFVSPNVRDASDFLNFAYGKPELREIPIWFSDTARTPDLLAAVDPTARAILANVRGVAPALPQGDLYDAFAADFAAEYDGADVGASAYAGYAWDATWLVLMGTAWSGLEEGGFTGLGTARGLRQISAGSDILLGADSWSSARAVFARGESFDVAGVSGALDYDASSEETSSRIDLWGIDAEGDGFVVLDTFDP